MNHSDFKGTKKRQKRKKKSIESYHPTPESITVKTIGFIPLIAL